MYNKANLDRSLFIQAVFSSLLFTQRIYYPRMSFEHGGARRRDEINGRRAWKKMIKERKKELISARINHIPRYTCTAMHALAIYTLVFTVSAEEKSQAV